MTDDPTLAERVTWLFQHRLGPDGKRVTNDSASDALAAMGVSASAVYLSHLRNGQRANPSAKILNALATHFDVPLDYFFNNDVAGEVIHQQEWDAIVRRPEVVELMEATHGVPSAIVRRITDLLLEVRKNLASSPNKK